MKFLFVLSIAVAMAYGCSPPSKRLSQAEAQSELEAAEIYSWSSGGCTDRNNPRCTSYDRIRCSTVQGLLKFRKDSGCAILINAGTEAGHSPGMYSHANGYKVQFRKNPCISNFISKKYKQIDSTHWKSGKNIYYAANNYWEVEYH
ncbi:hypothetical protein RhiJN_24299 [Ceratobasidium sp. AG-Ba]|nr:hypothetical protein RhiJN_24299 [Ceratobasidium sp. AG-Ba]